MLLIVCTNHHYKVTVKKDLNIDDEDTIACFFSSEIYGTEEAYKKASEAKEELSSWQYERR